MPFEQTGGAQATEETFICCHHWVIEPANGRYSRGECRNCKEVRFFENSIYASTEEDAE